MTSRRGRSLVFTIVAALVVGLALPPGAMAGKPLTFPVCGKLQFPASGQTTAYHPDTTGVLGATVPDDGTVQAGATLNYRDNGDGTITDLNTGLTWEKKSDDGSIHDKDKTFAWSDVDDPTIWDFIASLNTEGGTGFAGHNDWRIPNVKELQSIVDYETSGPAVGPAFDNGACGGGLCTVLQCSCTGPSTYWSSSTLAGSPTSAWFVGFEFGTVFANVKSNTFFVRAVRGGCL